jgi:hypothetical protein
VSPCKTQAVVSQHIKTPFSTVPLFNLGNNLMEPFVFSSQRAPMLSGKNSNGMQKVKFQWHVTACSTVWWNWFLQNFTAIFRFFIASKLSGDLFKCLPSPSFCCINFVLKLWSSNCCVIFGPMKILSFWPHIFWENFAWSRQTLRFIYLSLSQIFCYQT